MYSTTPYYLALATSTVLTFVTYPIAAGFTSFFFFELDVSTFEAVLAWTGILMT